MKYIIAKYFHSMVYTYGMKSKLKMTLQFFIFKKFLPKNLKTSHLPTQKLLKIHAYVPNNQIKSIT